MRILADLHISPVTIRYLHSLGHDIIRTDALLPPNAPDEDIVGVAIKENRVILTQDMDFGAILASSHRDTPSLISIRLAFPTVERVNSVLERVLPDLELAVLNGVMATVEDHRVRQRNLPI